MFHSIEIGRKIASYRKHLNMSQGFLAKLLSVSNQAVSKWESGDSIPDTINLTMLSEIFGVKLEMLFDYKGISDNKIIPQLYSRKDYSIVVENKYIDSTSNQSSKHTKNTILLNCKQIGINTNHTSTEHCVVSKTILQDCKIINAKNVNTLYIDNIYQNILNDGCVMDHCLCKLNKISGNITNMKFYYCITVDEYWENVNTKNCEVLFSSHTNITCINTTTQDAIWNNCIIYDSLFNRCTFKRLKIIKCHFKKCTFIDCIFDQQTYKHFNVEGNKMIRVKIVN